MVEQGFAFDAQKIEWISTEPPVEGLNRAELIVDTFRLPIGTLRRWTAIAVTDCGNYRMTVAGVDRDLAVKQLTLYFGPIIATRLVYIRQILIFDDHNRYIKCSCFNGAPLRAEDTFTLPYTMTLECT
jgi:hypothetical protein